MCLESKVQGNVEICFKMGRIELAASRSNAWGGIKMLACGLVTSFFQFGGGRQCALNVVA